MVHSPISLHRQFIEHKLLKIPVAYTPHLFAPTEATVAFSAAKSSKAISPLVSGDLNI